MVQKAKRVWFLAAPRTGVLNIAGPWEVLGHANHLLGYEAYVLELLGPHTPNLPTKHGLLLGNVRSLPRVCAHLPEMVVVAGGSPRYPLPEGDATIAAWIRRHHRKIPILVSICTGAFVLAAAGVLDGRRATTHWEFLSVLRERFPSIQVIDEGIYVRDGGVWTSAGLTAGIDLALALVEEDHGHQLAMAVAKRMVLFLRRSGNQAQFSASLKRQENAPDKLRNVATFVLEHMDEPLSVDGVARAIGMSPRSLSRWCRQHFKESPAKFIQQLRIDEARRLLTETSLPLKDITARSGLGDTSTLWRVFTRRFGVTPVEYRQRFHQDRPAI